jgi:subtilisin
MSGKPCPFRVPATLIPRFVLIVLLLMTTIPAAAERRRGDVDHGGLTDRGKPHIIASSALPVPDPAATSRSGAANRQERYIVRLKPETGASSERTRAMFTEPGILPTHVYEHVFPGFAAFLTPEAKRRLERDPGVLSVERDRRYRIDASNRDRPKKPDSFPPPDPKSTAQVIPTGITRIGTMANGFARINGMDERVNVDVAVIDTGIDPDHPDLYTWAISDCTGIAPNSSSYGRDIHGHGTHVAGTIAALDNGFGVVGVAPGARIWSIRTVDDTGFSTDAAMICGMDVVTRYAKDQYDGFGTIEVVNISLRGGSNGTSTCSTLAFHAAFCRMVTAGVTGVVAAGNDTRDAIGYQPAKFPEAITVSALADADGRSGSSRGIFQPCSVSSQQYDDGLATFSNYGASVDIAAPGVDVVSTYPTYFASGCAGLLGPGYAGMSGTSMASPHVAGAAALVKAVNPSFTAAQVRQTLLSARDNLAMPWDRDSVAEGILRVGVPGWPDKTPPVIKTVTGSIGTRTVSAVATDSGSGIANVEFRVNASQGSTLCDWNRMTISGTDSVAPYAVSLPRLAAGTYTVWARSTDRAGNTGYAGGNVCTRVKISSTGTIVATSSLIRAATTGSGSRSDRDEPDQKRKNTR